MKLSGILLFSCVYALAFSAAACSRPRNAPAVRGAPDAAQVENDTLPAASVWPASALLKTGEYPLWFELGPSGPVHIESPAAASLAPFVPWPHARHISGTLLWEGRLVMAVNRDGFLVLESGENPGEALLYHIPGGGFWDPYTAESLFVLNGKPAALLYRNDFFAEPAAAPLFPQVYLLDKSSRIPVSARIPVLEDYPSGGPWEAEILRRGPGGLWYFRMREKGKEKNETAFFRAKDLSGKPEKISEGEWRNSSLPEKASNIPASLAPLLAEADAPGAESVIKTLSPGFEEPRYFASSAASGDGNLSVLYAYCRETPSPLALLIYPDGRAFYSGGGSVHAFSLPALPENFVYTGTALLGGVLAASWEEQRLPSVGAAGFIVVSLPFP